MISLRDKEFLELLEGGGEVVGVYEMRCFMRRDHLLLLVPLRRSSALKTISLYQPQAILARLYSWLIQITVSVGLPIMLPKIRLNIRSNSPLARYVNGVEFGVLLGNPNSDARKAICWHEEDECGFVTKIGLGEAAKVSVEKEASFLARIASVISEAPSLCGVQSIQNYAEYTVKWINGKSPKKSDTEKLLDLLCSWQSRDEMQRLATTEIWLEVVKNASDSGDIVPRYLQRREVIPSRLHGDFAPWNIKITASGEINVLDWEFYRDSGVAGWDWAHYLVQKELLVNKVKPESVIRNVLNWAEFTEIGRDFMIKTGWSGASKEWLGSYLFYAEYILRMDRKELIRCWENQK